MGRLSELITKEELTRPESLELRKLAVLIEDITFDVGSMIGTSGVVSKLRAGSVVLDNAGMHAYYQGVETVKIERDGDVFIGSNVAAAATTSFVVLSNAQTYNSESLGAGDLLIGDNTASKANVLWDKSTGQLLFRGGTTTQGYIDTTGKAVFGGGHVEIDSGGIAIQTGQASTNLITWEDIANSDVTAYGKIYTYHIGTTPNKYGVMVVNAGEESGGSGTPLLWLQATNGVLTGNLQLLGSEGLAYTAQTATNNNIVNMLDFERTLTGNSADGFGFQLRFILDDDSSTKQTAGVIQTQWSDVSEGMVREDFFCPDTNTSFLAFDMLTASTFEMVVNDSSKDMNFRVESDGSENAIMVDGGLSAVGIMGVGVEGTALTVYGDVVTLHTAASTDEHAIEIDVDAAGFGDIKAIDIDYITGVLEAGEDEGVILVNIDETQATGGDIFAVEVLATDGDAGIYGLKTGVQIGPIHQDSGTFANPTTATDNTIGSSVTDTSIGFTQSPDTITDSNNGFGNFIVGEIVVVTGATTGANNTTYTITVATAGALTVTPQPNTVEDDGATITVDGKVPAMVDESTGTTTDIFEADNEYIIIGAAAAFQEMELILTTASSKNIKPTFWYSTSGAGQFSQFTPVDGTDGCLHTGVIAWDASDLSTPNHVANDTTGTFDIKIVRTKGGSITNPVLGYAKTAATTEYVWDKDGDVNIKDLTAAGTTSLDGAVTINESGVDIDFRVESDNIEDALFVRGSDGYVGVGTAAPSDPLTIYRTGAQASVSIHSDGTNQAAFLILDGTIANWSRIECRVAGTNSWVIGNYGSAQNTFSIYTTSSNTERLRVAADGGIFAYALLSASASTDVNIDGNNELHSVSSSKRFKKLIKPLDKRFDSSKIYDLKPASFVWNKKSGSAGETDFGLIAEEVQEIMPELVNLDSEGVPYSIRNSLLPIMLLAEIQKLNDRVEELEKGR